MSTAGRILRAVLALGVLGVLGGCAGTPTPAPDVAGMSDADRESAATRALAQYEEHVRSTFPGAVVPDVERVRFTSRVEYTAVQAACLTEEGFPASAGADGGVHFGDIPEAQAQAQSVAMYVCRARYPIDPRYAQPLNESQLRYLYAHYRDELLPCLRERGLETPALPSEETFVSASASGEGYDPLAFAAEALAHDDYLALFNRCPLEPALLWG